MPDASLASVLRPVSKANGLPNRHYTCEQAFGEERQDVFFANWAGLGVANAAPNPGDAYPLEFLGMPLVMVRGKDEKLRVFQNTCRHRGMILVTEAGRLRNVLRCPYHSWSYALDGALIATPHVGGPGHNTHEDIDRSSLGLVEIRSHVWQDIVFVNVSGNAPPFEDYAANLLERWSEFERPIHHGGADSGFQLEVNCNWKLAVENYCESYHLPWVHPGLNSYSRLEDHYNIERPGSYSGQGTLVYNPKPAEDGTAFADFTGLSDKWDTGAEYIALYPNVLLGVHRDHVFTIVLQPVAVDRTIEHVNIYYADEAALGPDYGDLRKRNTAMWHEVFVEDIFVVEGMQKGRAAPFFDGGRFSPAMDAPTHCFHAWVAGQLSAGEAGIG